MEKTGGKPRETSCQIRTTEGVPQKRIASETEDQRAERLTQSNIFHSDCYAIPCIFSLIRLAPSMSYIVAVQLIEHLPDSCAYIFLTLM